MSLTVLLNTASVSEPVAIAALHFFIDVLSADLRIKFFKALLLLTLTRFIADLIFGKLFTPFVKKCIIYMNRYNGMLTRRSTDDILAHMRVYMQA